MTENLEYRLLVLGPLSVGKTSLIIRLISGYFVEEYDPTMDETYRKMVEIDGKVATLEILDTQSLEEFEVLRDVWIRENQGFILVYSITSEDTFDEMDYFIKLIQKIKEEELDKISVILAGNKCDLEKHREISPETGQNLADSWKNTLGIKKTAFFETSAKDRIYNEEIFYEVVRLLRQIENEKNETNNTNESKNNKCCQIL